MAARAGIAEERALQQRLARIEELVGELQKLPDPAARAAVEEVISTVLELHGAALARLLELVGERGEDGDSLLSTLAGDELVRDVLLLHGLHPVDLRTRVENALESVRPYMRSHGGGVELVGVADDVVRIRLEGHCQGCPSSTMTLKLAVEKAIYEAAPDVQAIEVDDDMSAAPSGPPDLSGLVPLPLLPGRPAAPAVAAPPPPMSGAWTSVALTTQDVPDGGLVRLDVDGLPVVISRLGPILYAYRAACPACAGGMTGARLAGPTLVCGDCEAGFDVRRAGRGVDSDHRLEPLPLLDEAGSVRIATPAHV
jgi:Fe-S cluster biogenesis protein NfuA/nitrite reductase/ring-hydroxylating ferredoxin subunit